MARISGMRAVLWLQLVLLCFMRGAVCEGSPASLTTAARQQQRKGSEQQEQQLLRVHDPHITAQVAKGAAVVAGALHADAMDPDGMHVLFRADTRRARLQEQQQIVTPPGIVTVLLEFAQDWDLTARLYNIDMGDFGPAISSTNLQQATWDTFFQHGAPLESRLAPSNDIGDINCTLPLRLMRNTLGGQCQYQVTKAASGSESVMDVVSNMTRTFATNAGMLCQSTLVWTVIDAVASSRGYICGDSANITGVREMFNAAWLCCDLFTPNAPSSAPPPLPPNNYSPDNRLPPFEPTFPHWPELSPPAPPPAPPSPPHAPNALQQIADKSLCGDSSLGYTCVRAFGDVTLHWSLSLELPPQNNCTAGALILASTSTSSSSSDVPAQNASLPQGMVWAHYAIEAQRADGTRPAWVGVAFAQTAGVMAPAVAVIGAGFLEIGKALVQVQLLTQNGTAGSVAPELQALISFAGLTQQGPTTTLCFSIPVSAASAPSAPPEPVWDPNTPPSTTPTSSSPPSPPVVPPDSSASSGYTSAVERGSETGRRKLAQQAALVSAQQWLPASFSADTPMNWAVGPASGNLSDAWWAGSPIPSHESAGGMLFNLHTGVVSNSQQQQGAPEPSQADQGLGTKTRMGLLVAHTCLLAASFLMLFAGAGFVMRHRHVLYKLDGSQGGQYYHNEAYEPEPSKHPHGAKTMLVRPRNASLQHQQSNALASPHQQQATAEAKDDEQLERSSYFSPTAAAGTAWASADHHTLPPIHGATPRRTSPRAQHEQSPDEAADEDAQQLSSFKRQVPGAVPVAESLQPAFSADASSPMGHHDVMTERPSNTLTASTSRSSRPSRATAGSLVMAAITFMPRDSSPKSPAPAAKLGLGAPWQLHGDGDSDDGVASPQQDAAASARAMRAVPGRTSSGKMARWLKTHLVLNALGLLCFALAFVLGVVWWQMDGQHTVPTGVVALHQVLGYLCAVLLCFQVISPLLSLQHPPAKGSDRPNVHQITGRVLFALGLAYLALAIVLLTTAPSITAQRTKQLVPAIVVPISLWLLVLAFVDIRLRRKYGNPRRNAGTVQETQGRSSAGGGSKDKDKPPAIGDRNRSAGGRADAESAGAGAAAFGNLRELQNNNKARGGMVLRDEDEEDEEDQDAFAGGGAGTHGSGVGGAPRGRRVRLSGSGWAEGSGRLPTTFASSGSLLHQQHPADGGSKAGDSAAMTVPKSLVPAPIILTRGASSKREGEQSGMSAGGTPAGSLINTAVDGVDDALARYSSQNSSACRSPRVLPVHEERVSPHLNPHVIKDANSARPAFVNMSKESVRPSFKAGGLVPQALAAAATLGALTRQGNSVSPSPLLIPTSDEKVFLEAPSRTSNNQQMRRLAATPSSPDVPAGPPASQLPPLVAQGGRSLMASQSMLAMARLPSLGHTHSTPSKAAEGGGPRAGSNSNPVGVLSPHASGHASPDVQMWSAAPGAARGATSAGAGVVLHQSMTGGPARPAAYFPAHQQQGDGSVRLPASSAVAWAAPTGVLPPLSPDERSSAPSLAARKAGSPLALMGGGATVSPEQSSSVLGSAERNSFPWSLAASGVMGGARGLQGLGAEGHRSQAWAAADGR